MSRESDGWIMLISAAAGGCLEAVWLLCDTGADLSDRSNESGTAFMLAALNGYLEVAQLLC